MAGIKESPTQPAGNISFSGGHVGMNRACTERARSVHGVCNDRARSLHGLQLIIGVG